ncbi:hypothetical protein FJT64_021478 [Amphibalanus amphitrite]|uniref:Uncharacterized protein n=1 Tax=Amphibalanus amphitrite TaxID=1232801 RepID=A0A6A4WYI3_AMPAM|nr:hypothetical protein FJT64_021478 [Amphibalanus amphitrite]
MTTCAFSSRRVAVAQSPPTRVQPVLMASCDSDRCPHTNATCTQVYAPQMLLRVDGRRLVFDLMDIESGCRAVPTTERPAGTTPFAAGPRVQPTPTRPSSTTVTVTQTVSGECRDAPPSDPDRQRPPMVLAMFAGEEGGGSDGPGRGPLRGDMAPREEAPPRRPPPGRAPLLPSANHQTHNISQALQHLAGLAGALPQWPLQPYQLTEDHIRLAGLLAAAYGLGKAACGRSPPAHGSPAWAVPPRPGLSGWAQGMMGSPPVTAEDLPSEEPAGGEDGSEDEEGERAAALVMRLPSAGLSSRAADGSARRGVGGHASSLIMDRMGELTDDRPAAAALAPAAVPAAALAPASVPADRLNAMRLVEEIMDRHRSALGALYSEQRQRLDEQLRQQRRAIQRTFDLELKYVANILTAMGSRDNRPTQADDDDDNDDYGDYPDKTDEFEKGGEFGEDEAADEDPQSAETGEADGAPTSPTDVTAGVSTANTTTPSTEDGSTPTTEDTPEGPAHTPTASSTEASEGTPITSSAGLSQSTTAATPAVLTEPSAASTEPPAASTAPPAASTAPPAASTAPPAPSTAAARSQQASDRPQCPPFEEAAARQALTRDARVLADSLFRIGLELFQAVRPDGPAARSALPESLRLRPRSGGDRQMARLVRAVAGSQVRFQFALSALEGRAGALDRLRRLLRSGAERRRTPAGPEYNLTMAVTALTSCFIDGVPGFSVENNLDGGTAFAQIRRQTARLQVSAALTVSG